jgi:hypothetical protein
LNEFWHPISSLKRTHPYQLFLFLLFALCNLAAHAQYHDVKGRIVNAQDEPIPYATIQVKGIPSGVLAKDDGSFEFSLGAGKYKLRVSAVGFKMQEEGFEVPDTNLLKIVMEEDHASLDEVVVQQKVKDRANELIHMLVSKKDSIRSASGAYSFQLYSKSIIQQSDKKRLARQGVRLEKVEDDDEAQITETVSNVDYNSGKIKEERIAVRGNTNATGLFSPSVSEEDFSVYNDLLKLPSLSPTPFLSPVSKAGLMAYKFKTIKKKRNGKYSVYTISVKPLQVTNATIEGELTVTDSAWVVLHAKYRLPEYHLQEFDFFEVEQDFSFINNQAWMMTSQEFNYYKKNGKEVYAGKTLSDYTRYELNKNYTRKYFSNEVSSTREEAFNRDSSFWKTIRTAPLTEEEMRIVRYEDSLLAISKTDAYRDSVDRSISRITWPKMLLFGQSLQDHRKERVWHFSPVASIYQPIAFGGSRIRGYAFVEKTYSSRKQIRLNTELSYGIRNDDLNGSVEFFRKFNPHTRANYSISAGRDFAFINEGDAWVNMIKKSNIYLNNYIGGSYGTEIVNGLEIGTEAQLALRRSVANYKTGKFVDSLGISYLDNNLAVDFNPYNALYGKLHVQYTPAQRYKREPREKVILGSKWPTFYADWEKGINGPFNSKIDFDYVEFGLKQNISFGLIGQSQYSIRTGDYFNRKDLRFIDYKFQRRGDPILFMDPNRSFQALDSSFALTHRYYEGHIFHQFNGLLVNKIPLLKKLKLREVAGAGLLIAPERKLQYGELFAGIERAFQSPLNALDKFKLGIYVVSSASNQFKNPVQFKIGFTTWDKRRNKWR